MLHESTVLNSAIKPAAPPVLRVTRLLDQVRERIRYKHYSLRTEQAYVQWVRMFVKWHGFRHPRDMGQLEIEGFLALLARLLYGTGMRLMEGLRLRVNDVDFDRGVVVVRQAKGDKDPVVKLPRSLTAELRQQVLAARALWEQDRQAQRGGVEVQHALETKYPGVGQRWGWFWVFPASSLSVDPRTGVWQRHHLYEERYSAH